MTRRVRRLGTVAVVVAGLVLAACGGGGRSDGAADDSPAATGSSGPVQFGDLASPCGPGQPSGSPDQAVDATSVTIGYGDDAGFQGNPGSNHEMSDAVEALISWCNEQGGIGGRQVKGIYYDAKITEVNNVMTEACGQVFMLVGQGFALGAGGEATRLGCGLPSVPGLLGGTDVANAPLMVTPAPQPVDHMNVEGAAAIAEAYPDAVKKVGVMLPNFPATIDFTQRAMRTFPTVGWQFLDCTQTYPISGVSDFRPFLQKLKECGAEVVLSTDTGNNLQNALDAARQIDFDPIWMVTSAIYTSSFADWNVNGNADKVHFGNVFVPLEDVTPGSANAAYVDLVTASGGDISYTGQQAASAFLLWATAAEACGADLTRACVMQQLRGVHDWTAGGMSSAQDPGGNKPGDCGLVIKVEGTAFVQWQPAGVGEFTCDPSYLAKVDPPIDSARRAAAGRRPDRPQERDRLTPERTRPARSGVRSRPRIRPSITRGNLHDRRTAVACQVQRARRAAAEGGRRVGGAGARHVRRRRRRGLPQPDPHPPERALQPPGVRPRSSGVPPHRVAHPQLHRRQLRRRVLRDPGRPGPRVHRARQPRRCRLHLVHHGVRCRRRRLRHPDLGRAERHPDGHRRRRQLRDPPRWRAGRAQLAGHPRRRRSHHHPPLLRVPVVGLGVADAARPDQHRGARPAAAAAAVERRAGRRQPPARHQPRAAEDGRRPEAAARRVAGAVRVDHAERLPAAGRAREHGLRRVRRGLLDGPLPDRPRRGAGDQGPLARVRLRQRLPLEPLVADVRLREPPGQPEPGQHHPRRRRRLHHDPRPRGSGPARTGSTPRAARWARSSGASSCPRARSRRRWPPW